MRDLPLTCATTGRKKGTGKLADPKKEIVHKRGRKEKPKQVTWRVAAVAAVMAGADRLR